MAGRMGGEQVTVQNLQVLKVDKEQNLLIVKGAVPGAKKFLCNYQKMELVVLNTSGKETGRKVQLDDTIFGIEPNQHAVYLEVKQYLAAQRQGTHKSKERSEITASTKN